MTTEKSIKQQSKESLNNICDDLRILLRQFKALKVFDDSHANDNDVDYNEWLESLIGSVLASQIKQRFYSIFYEIAFIPGLCDLLEDEY